MSLESRIADFKETIQPLILDPEGTHHVFNSKQHGQKLDFEKIPQGGPEYDEWVGITADGIMEFYDPCPRYLIGVANGTNDFSIDVAGRLIDMGQNVTALTSVKREGASSILDARSVHELRNLHNGIASHSEFPAGFVVLEDAATTGLSSAEVADDLVLWGNGSIGWLEVLNTWQRTAELPELIGRAMAYRSLIIELLPTYSATDCQTLEDGFCRRWGDPIPHGE